MKFANVSETYTVRVPVGEGHWPKSEGQMTPAAGAIQRAYARTPGAFEKRREWSRKRFFHYLLIEHPVGEEKVVDVVRLPGWSSTSLGNVLTWTFWLSRHLTALTHGILPWRATYGIHSVGFEADLDRESYEGEIGDCEQDQGL